MHLQAPVLLTQRHVQERVKLQTDAQILTVDADWPSIAQQPSCSPGVQQEPRRLMYMIFTSGGYPSRNASSTESGILTTLRLLSTEAQSA